MQKNRPEKVLVVSNLFPDELHPHHGSFVKNMVDQLCSDFAVKVVHLSNQGRSKVLNYLKFYVAAFLEALKPHDVIYVHYVSHSVAPVLLASLLSRQKKKVVLNYHGSDAFSESFENPIKSTFKSKICQQANRGSALIVAPSRDFKRRLIAKFGLDDSQVFVSPSAGVSTTTFYPPPVEHQASRPRRVLWASRMISGKGGLIAARAVSRALDEDFELEAVFVGDGPEKSTIESILKTSKHPEKVQLKPAVSQPELANLFRWADIFLFPSTREGESLGLVVVEAIFCGAIPIVINNGAMAEIIPSALASKLIASSEAEYIDSFTDLLNQPHQDLTAISTDLRNSTRHYQADAVGKDLNCKLATLLKQKIATGKQARK